jgi:hypothetical protein
LIQQRKKGYPENYRSKAPEVFTTFVNNIYYLRAKGFCSSAYADSNGPSVGCYTEFYSFCSIMGTAEITTPISKYSRAFYDEISDHNAVHSSSVCFSEMKAMSDVLIGRAVTNYGSFGTSYLAKFDGESMFNGVSQKSWANWTSQARGCIADAILSDRVDSLVLAYSLGYIRANDSSPYTAERLSTLSSSLNFISFFEGYRAPIQGETKVQIGSTYFSTKVPQ